MTEHDLVLKAINYFKSIDQLCIEEVPISGRCIDLIIVGSKSIRSIEFKLSNWKKAILQAKDHQLYADKSYICMPRPAKGFNKKFLSTCKKNGIGIIEYCYTFNVILPAKFNNQWTPMRKSLINRLEKISAVSIL